MNHRTKAGIVGFAVLAIWLGLFTSAILRHDQRDFFALLLMAVLCTWSALDSGEQP